MLARYELKPCTRSRCDLSSPAAAFFMCRCSCTSSKRFCAAVRESEPGGGPDDDDAAADDSASACAAAASAASASVSYTHLTLPTKRIV